jgi:2-methylisocitrate lyase-like PEP mutase family enzyme
MSGYGVSLSRLGDPDVGLASFADVLDAGTHICRAAGDVPMVGDGDTGFGGVANVRRTVLEFHRAGFAAVSIEDQVFPKRCAFAKGVRVVDRPDALARLRAALDARDEIRRNGGDILVIGRTDCRLATNVSDGFEEALWRCAAFEDMGADVVYFEAPRSEKEMETFNQRRSIGALDVSAGGARRRRRRGRETDRLERGAVRRAGVRRDFVRPNAAQRLRGGDAERA